YAKAVQAQNQRSRALAKARAEALALEARFGVDVPTLPRVLAPDQRAASFAAVAAARVSFAQAENVLPVVEEDTTGLRRLRRTFEEVADMASFNIIMQAGLPDFRPLTARDQAVLTQHEQQRAANSEILRTEAEAELGH